MKNLLFLSMFAFALIFSSCGSETSGNGSDATEEAATDNSPEALLAKDVCKMMDKFPDAIDSDKEKESFLNEVYPFVQKFDELEKAGVTQEQFMKAMKKICSSKADIFANAMDAMEM